jgi:regulator of protease activity HflC (stomatin/prohibitin superfamily)
MTQATQACSRGPTKPTIVVSRDKRTLTVRIPVKFRMHRAGKQVVTPSGEVWATAPRVDSALVQAIVRAHRWREMLETGKHGTAADLAKAEKVNDSYLSRMLRLTLLAPDIVEAILDGRQPRSLELSTLLQPLPFSWEQQSKLLDLQGTSK